jgi:NOL1/NOP2/sun family putative RNA methylase
MFKNYEHGTTNHKMIQLPDSFVSQMQSILGDEYALFEASLKTTSPTSIRYNPFKNVDRLAGKLVPWAENAVYLAERPDFSQDPFWHSGAYYVQEAGSMFTAHLVEQLLPRLENPVILDLCAAPGGKSTHLASILHNKGLLVSNEVVRARLNILQENLIKWGLPNCVITNNDPANFARTPNFFDIVVVDAPCSGEGLFRKQADAVDEWSEKQVEFCSSRQRRILEDIWPSIRPGGFFVYSTCTYNQKENEDNVRWITEHYDTAAVHFQVDPKWNVTVETNNLFSSFRFYPHKTSTEGFFITVLQKQEEDYRNPNLHTKYPYFSRLTREESPRLKSWHLDANVQLMKQPNGIINLLPTQFYAEIEVLAQKLKVVYCGTEMCEIKGKNANPLQSFGNSVLLNKEEFSVAEVDIENALLYLAKSDFEVDCPIGHNLISYQNIPLGWIKNMPNRINNYFPQEWRLRNIK